MEEIPSNDKDPSVFMFINSASGGGVGQQLLALNMPQIAFSVPRSHSARDKGNLVTVMVHLFDLKKQGRKEGGFRMLKEAVQREQNVILVICGGDGTVMWVVSLLGQYEIDHMKVPIAMLPLGTGNDFSRVLEWGKEAPTNLIDNAFEGFKEMIVDWITATPENLDIWMVEASVHDYGKFEKVDAGQTKVLQDRLIQKHFCNYFSIGVDGKVGYSFDLHRTSSRIGNLVVYGTMGVVKAVTKTKTIQELTKSFREYDKESKLVPTSKEQVHLANESTRQLQQARRVILEEGNPLMQEVKNNENLLFLNINSFMAGVKDIWHSAKTPEANRNANFSNRQSYSDGKIEIMSFGGVMGMGFEKSIGGFATRVYQGTGPFEFEFNTFPPDEKHRTYLQIDGEFIRYTHPKQVRVQKSNLSRTGQIRVLQRVLFERQCGCC